MKYPRIFEMFLFGCIGIAVEVFFVAVADNFWSFKEAEMIDVRLMGHSYLWMFLLYIWIPVGYHLAMPRLAKWSIWLRLLLYTFIFMLIEFVAGAMLDLCTGACPWDYTGKSMFSIWGYTRLDYFFFWGFFAFFCEKMCDALQRYRDS